MSGWAAIPFKWAEVLFVHCGLIRSNDPTTCRCVSPSANGNFAKDFHPGSKFNLILAANRPGLLRKFSGLCFVDSPLR
jgi:hypothetical protein